MAQLDIINAAGKAYKTVWDERVYLMRLAAIPFILKLVCFTIANMYAGEESGGSYLRFMLIMVPALMAEGWMLAHFVRTIMLGQRWPFRPTGDHEADMAVITVRARCILSAMIVFVLINLLLGLVMALAGQVMMPYVVQGEKSSEVPLGIGLLSAAILTLMVGGFRFLWLYIAYAIEMPFEVYVQALRGFGVTISLIGIWLLCLVPFLLMLQLTAAALTPVFTTALGEDVSGFVMMLLTVATDTLKSITVTAGITYALQDFFIKRRQTA